MVAPAPGDVLAAAEVSLALRTKGPPPRRGSTGAGYEYMEDMA